MAKTSEQTKTLSYLAARDEGFKAYFSLLPELLEKISSKEPALAYCFQRVEMAQRNGLYALLMREYRTDSDLSWRAIGAINITRNSYSEIFESVSGKKFQNDLRELIKPAEKIRDSIMHGRKEIESNIQRSIRYCLEYSFGVNELFQKECGFKPFGPLTGITSKKGKPQLDKKISQAILKGLLHKYY